MYRQAALVICMVLPSMAFFPPPEGALNKYAEKKAWKACIGENVANSWSISVSNAVNQCKGIQSRSPVRPTFQSPRPIIVTTSTPFHGGFPSTFSPNFIPGNSIGPGSQVPFIVNNNNNNLPVVFAVTDQLPLGSRVGLQDRRNSAITANDLLEAEEDLRSRVTNFTCVLQTLDVIDNRGQIRFSKIAQDIANMPADNFLKKDLLEVLNMCASVSTCIPQMKSTSTIVPPEIQKVMSFMTCVKKIRQVACMKNDIRTYLRQGIPSNVNRNFNLENTVERILHVKLASVNNPELSLLV